MFETVNRDGTHTEKWERYRSKNLIPMWVADMDLAVAAPIQQALLKRTEHPVFGYTQVWQSANQSVVDWCRYRYQLTIEPEWIVWMPGVVPSFNLAVDVWGRGGRVIVQSPNYPPMLAAAENNGCQTVALPITWNGASWQWDWQQLEQEMSHPECHLFLLCNPMNPHGSVLNETDLKRLGELAKEHQVFICSDEIHCDLILDGTPHTPAIAVDDIAAHGLTLMAASKTFNVAGLGCSFAIIPEPTLRHAWNRRMQGRIPHPNFLGLVAAEAAFNECREWHERLLAHLQANQQIVAKAIRALAGMNYYPQPATFLAWIESANAEVSLDEHFMRAGIMPSEGKFFGSPTSVRLNFGCGETLVTEALEKLSDYWHRHVV